MDVLLQQIINGLVLGSMYALVALGYTMVYGILELINFAHGEVVMIGAMVTLAVVNALLASGVDMPGIMLVATGLLVAVAVCMALGFAIERIAYHPVIGMGRDRSNAILTPDARLVAHGHTDDLRVVAKPPGRDTQVGQSEQVVAQTHDGGDAAQQHDAHAHGGQQTDPPTRLLLPQRQPACQDDDEDDVVDPQHDLHQGQCHQGNQCFRHRSVPGRVVLGDGALLASHRTVQRARGKGT